MKQKARPYKKYPVYVLDIDEESRLAAKAELESQGYEVKAFGNPKRAEKAFADRVEKFDSAIIVVDISLGEMSGYEFVRRLANTCMQKKIPIVMTAKYDSPEDRSEASQVGANALIKRPLSWDSFYNALEDYRLRLLKSEIGEMVFEKEQE